MKRKIALAWVSGMGMGITSAPLEDWYLAWIALIPLWFLVHTDKQPNAYPKSKNLWQTVKSFVSRHRLSLLYSLAWGVGYQGFILFWITGVHPLTWMGVPWFWSLCIAAACWLIITGWGMAIPLLWTLGMLIFRTQTSPENPGLAYRLNRVIFGSALWCVIEFFWSRSDLFWHFLAFSQSPHNLSLLQLTRFSGFTTVTLIIVMVNGFLTESLMAYRQPRRSPSLHKLLLGLSITVLIGTHLWGWSLFKSAQLTTDQPARIGIIQGNIPNEIKLYENGTSRAITNYTRGYRELTAGNDADNPQLIVTPETALPFKIEQIIGWTDIYRAIKEQNVPIILGAFGSEGKNFTNSLFTVGSQGDVLSRYNKQQLVPLGEYIPFEAVLGRIIDRLSPLDAHLVRGQNPKVVATPIGKATVAICYESAYPEHFRRQTAVGGKYIIVSSNDAHYSATMPAQHHALDVMQAIANDRWTVRASNTGYSGIISPDGQTQWISNLDQYAVHQTEIYLKNNKTLYVRFGNWLVLLCAITVLSLGLYWKRNSQNISVQRQN